jgi:hypothetical protein
MRRRGVAAFLIGLWGLGLPGLGASAPAAFAATSTVGNGGFETGSLAGWTVTDQPGSDGSWFAYAGTEAPDSHSVLPLPPAGTYAAITDQLGHGTHVLSQDLAITPSTAVLAFQVFYVNQADRFVTPASFDFQAGPNQQFRVDVLRAGADPLGADPGSVLVSAFATKVGDPLELSATRVQIDLSAWSGQTVRLRAVEVDTLQFLNAGIDDVTLTPAPSGPTTTTGAIATSTTSAGTGATTVPAALPVTATPSFTG